MNTQICDNIKLNKQKLSFEIYNKLRLLGIRTSHHGATLIYLAVLIIVSSNKDLIILEDVYSDISKQLGIGISQIRRSIQYTIDSRKIKKTERNFEIVFGYENDPDLFTNKRFIEELSRVIKYNL